MNGYLSVREMACRWNVSERRVSQYCEQKRIPGAERFGRSWAIPVDAEKPTDPRRENLAGKRPRNGKNASEGASAALNRQNAER